MFTVLLLISDSLLLWTLDSKDDLDLSACEVIGDSEERTPTAALKSVPKCEANSMAKIMDRKGL